MNIKRMRQAGRVLRYHTHPLIVRENVAEHTFNVMNLLLALGAGGNANLMLYALLHDQGEWKTGDVPSTVKRSVPGIKEAVDSIEKSALPRPLPELSAEEYRLFKTADNLDGLIKVLEELRLGNDVMIEVGKEYRKYLRELWPDEDIPQLVLDYITEFSLTIWE